MTHEQLSTASKSYTTDTSQKEIAIRFPRPFNAPGPVPFRKPPQYPVTHSINAMGLAAEIGVEKEEEEIGKRRRLTEGVGKRGREIKERDGRINIIPIPARSSHMFIYILLK